MLKKLLITVGLLFLVLSRTYAADKDLQLLSRSSVALDDPGLSPAQWRWIREHQRLRLAVWQPMSPPYDITTGLNDYGGINADYIGIIADNLNLKVEVKRYASYDEALGALRAGRADILAQADLSQRRAGLLLSQPYSINRPVEVINIDTPAEKHVENIAVCAGYDGDLLQASYPDAKIKSYSSSRHALEALAFRHLDVFICDAVTAQYLISQSNLSNLSTRPLAHPYKTVGFAFAALEQNKRWIEAIDKVLAALPMSVNIEIHRRWNGGIPLSLSEERPRFTSLENKWIAEHPKVNVAVVAENMPVSWFTPGGQLRGIIADILTALRLRTGFVFTIRQYSGFEAALAAVENGESDIIAGAIEESIWQHHLLTTRSWLYNSWVMVGRKEYPQSKQSARIVVQAAQAPQQWLHQHEKEQVDIVENWRAGLERVNKGKSDIMIMPLLVANEWLLSADYSSLKILGSVDTPPMRFAFGASDRLYPLIAIFNKALNNIPPEDLHAITRSGGTNELALSNVSPLLAYKKLWLLLATVSGLGIALAVWRILTLRRRVRGLTIAAARAQEGSQLKSAFLATMSHEIRTHVSAVSGMLELVIERPRDVELNQQRVRVAQQGAQALLALIGNILDVSRIEAGKLVLHPERASLLELVESAAVLFESQALQHGLSFHLELDSELEGQVLIDPLRFRQIVSNLLNNGIKFTPAGGSVTLRAIRENAPSAKTVSLRLEVEDSGKGIEPAVLTRLFQPFSQGENQQVGQGSGLGLYICRRLAEMMGGKISLESELGQGTKVTVVLSVPGLAPLADAVRTAAASEPAPLRELTVLVVDDNPAGRMLLSHQLQHLAHRVICFASGEALMSYLADHSASLVITDCNMPGMDGFALAEALRERYPQLSVFGVTADARDGTRERAIAAGMKACLFKPVTLECLAENLKCLMDQEPTAARKPAFTLPEALTGEDNVRAFLRLQLGVLEETQAWLAGGSPCSDADARSRLHRLRGGLQLLGVADIEALCLSMEQDLRPEGVEELRGLLDGLSSAIQARLQELSNVLRHDEERSTS